MYVMLFGMVGTAVSAINGSVSFVLGQTYHTDRAHFLRLYRAFETYNMALTFALYLTADVFILPFLKLYTAGVTDISYLDPVLPHLFVCTYLLSNGRAAAQRVIEYAGHFQKRRTVPSSNPSSIFSYRFCLWCRLACTACSSGQS